MFVFFLSMAMLFSAGIVAKPKSVLACSCVAPLSAEKQVKDALERKSAIFKGEVIQVKQPQRKIMMSSADPVKVTLEVTRVWKGELGRQSNVYTALSSASCGIENFQVGMKYIVSANKNSKQQLETSICDLTKPISSAGAEF
jgi:hypothetical protein